CRLGARVTAVVVDAAGVEQAGARRVQVIRDVALVHELPGAGGGGMTARAAVAELADQRVERLRLERELDAALPLGRLDGRLLLVHGRLPGGVEELEGQRLPGGD